MSLHTLAQHLQSAGRHGDTMLVHMTPGEVQGLQALAMANGGSLTINPETGLPEAFFLAALLPAIAGMGLKAAGMSALTSALTVGAIGTVATGSLGKGLMMGLGAYGGAGLGSGLLGSAAASQAAASQAAAAAPSAAASAALDASKLGAIGASPAGVAMPAAPTTVMGAAPAGGSMIGGKFVANPTVPTTIPNPSVTAVSPSIPKPVASVGVEQAVQKPSMFDQLGQNFGKFLGDDKESEEYRKEFFKKYKVPLAATGVSALMLSQQNREAPQLAQPGEPITPSRTYTGEYTSSPTPGLSGERQYTFLADGGLANLPVEQMSQQASTGANTNYPMANIRPYGYAVPRNVPISENVFKPMDYQRTDPFTGEQQFAGGGLTALATGGFISKLKPVPKPTETKPKLASTDALDKRLKSLEAFSDLGKFEGQVNDLRSRLAELNKNRKANARPIEELNRQLKAATSALNNARTYRSTVAARDKIVAANEAAKSKAQATFDAAMAKYNEYKEKLDAERNEWQEQTGRKATGVQSIRPTRFDSAEQIQNKLDQLQKQKMDIISGKLKSPDEPVNTGPSFGIPSNQPAKTSEPSTASIDKQIADLTAQLKTAGQFKPITKFSYDTTNRLMEEQDITAIFEDVAGRRPTAAEMDRFLGVRTNDAAIASFATKLPDVTAKMSYTDDDLRENWKYYIGREPTSGELAAMKKAKPGNFNQLRTFIKGQPAFLENINRLGSESASAEAMAAAKLPVDAIASIFRDVLGRQPTMQEIQQYSRGQTQQSLTELLKGTEDYKKKFTQGLVPGLSYMEPGRYAPGTVLEYRPETQERAGLGAISTVVPTASGMQTPQTRGRVTIEGAMPLNPTFQEQLGLQTLATQAAQIAPPLQQGLRFDAPTAQPAPGQLMPGLTGLPQLPPQAQIQERMQPQKYEEQLANIGARQIQPAATQPAAPVQPAVVPVNEAGIPITALANTAPVTTMAMGGYAGGGYNLGDYSDGGRLLKGPGDGVSDSIPASIGNRQPARLADGEFVIPARIVSEIGNGSTDAGARRLYAMMDRVQRARRKSIGKGKVAVDSKAEKLLPA